MRRATLLVAALLLSGCVAHENRDPAAITGFTPDKVTVRSGLGTTKADVLRQARKVCGTYGRKPRFLYERCRPYCLGKYHTFACV